MNVDLSGGGEEFYSVTVIWRLTRSPLHDTCAQPILDYHQLGLCRVIQMMQNYNIIYHIHYMTYNTKISILASFTSLMF